MSTKLDNRVLFPIDDMDVGDYMNVTDSDEDLIYDLQSAVNHYGGELFINSNEICDDKGDVMMMMVIMKMGKRRRMVIW